MSKLLDHLLEAWETHDEINRFILRWVPPEGLEGWKTSPAAWLMYPVSRESHHRGQIAQALKPDRAFAAS